MAEKLSEELKHCLDGKGCGNCSNYQSESRLTCPGLLKKAYEVVKRYEEMFPCKIEDIVYDVVLCDDGKYRIFEMKVCNINPFGDVRKGKVWNVYLEDDCTKAYRSFYDFNKTVFLEKEAAEKALKEMEDRK